MAWGNGPAFPRRLRACRARPRLPRSPPAAEDRGGLSSADVIINRAEEGNLRSLIPRCGSPAALASLRREQFANVKKKKKKKKKAHYMRREEARVTRDAECNLLQRGYDTRTSTHEWAHNNACGTQRSERIPRRCALMIAGTCLCGGWASAWVLFEFPLRMLSRGCRCRLQIRIIIVRYMPIKDRVKFPPSK